MYCSIDNRHKLPRFFLNFRSRHPESDMANTLYELTQFDLSELSGPEGLPAFIRALKLPDTRVLWN